MPAVCGLKRLKGSISPQYVALCALLEANGPRVVSIYIIASLRIYKDRAFTNRVSMRSSALEARRKL